MARTYLHDHTLPLALDRFIDDGCRLDYHVIACVNEHARGQAKVHLAVVGRGGALGRGNRQVDAHAGWRVKPEHAVSVECNRSTSGAEFGFFEHRGIDRFLTAHILERRTPVGAVDAIGGGQGEGTQQLVERGAHGAVRVEAQCGGSGAADQKAHRTGTHLG